MSSSGHSLILDTDSGAQIETSPLTNSSAQGDASEIHCKVTKLSQKEFSIPLFEAIEAGELAQIDAILKAGYSLDLDSGSSLATAIMVSKNSSPFFYLLSAGASLDAPGEIYTLPETVALGCKWPRSEKCSALDVMASRGLTLPPIFWAAVKDDPQTVLAEIEKGNLLQQDSQGNNLVSYLSANGNLTLLRRLYLSNASLFLQRNKQNSSPLLFACSNGHLAVVTWLVTTVHADIEDKTAFGYNALMMAASNGFIDIVKWLVQIAKAKVDERDQNGLTALMCAASKGSYCLPVMKWLATEGGCSITDLDNNGCPAPWYALNCLEVLQWMVKHHGSVDFGWRDSSLLIWAAESGRINCMKWLLEEGGSSLEERAYDHRTPYLTAVYYGKFEVVKWLHAEYHTKISGDVNADGATALLTAASVGNIHIVEWLIKQGGASITEVDSKGLNVLYYAAFGGHMDLVKWLVAEMGVDVARSHALLAAARSGHLELIEWLFARGGQVTEADSKQRSVLYHAASGGHLSVVKWLVKHGANVSAKDKSGVTALIMAAWTGSLEIVQWLVLEGGANITDHALGRSLVVHAAGHLDVVKWLVEKCDADISQRRHNEHVLTSVAAQEGFTATLKWILREKRNFLELRDSRFILEQALLQNHAHLVTCLLVDFNICQPEELQKQKYSSTRDCFLMCKNTELMYSVCMEYDLKQRISVCQFAAREALQGHLLPVLQDLVHLYNERTEEELEEMHGLIFAKYKDDPPLQLQSLSQSWDVSRGLMQDLMQTLHRQRPESVSASYSVICSFKAKHAPALTTQPSLSRSVDDTLRAFANFLALPEAKPA